MSGPVEDEEQCFCSDFAEPVSRIRVTGKRLKKAITFTYDNKYLPCFTEWKSMLAGDYALGIEPASSSFIGDLQYSNIKAGQEIEIKFNINVEDVK